MPKIITGEVVSTKMKNVVVVEIERSKVHPKYHKRIKRTKRVKAQSSEPVKVGDKVSIQEIAPISNETNWKVLKIIKEKQHGTA